LTLKEIVGGKKASVKKGLRRNVGGRRGNLTGRRGEERRRKSRGTKKQLLLGRVRKKKKNEKGGKLGRYNSLCKAAQLIEYDAGTLTGHCLQI